MTQQSEAQAKLLEYEHALEHVTARHDGLACPDCQRLARGALDGANRNDFRQMARDQSKWARRPDITHWAFFLMGVALGVSQTWTWMA